MGIAKSDIRCKYIVFSPISNYLEKSSLPICPLYFVAFFFFREVIVINEYIYWQSQLKCFPTIWLTDKSSRMQCRNVNKSTYTVSGSNKSQVPKVSWVNEKAPTRYTQASFGYLFIVSYRDAEQSPERSI